MIDTLLAPYYSAGYPIVALETCEERRAVECFLQRWPDKQIFSISAFGGLLDEKRSKVQDNAANFPKSFEFISTKDEAMLVVFDFQHIVSGAAAYRALLRFLPSIKGRGSMVVLVAPSWNLPAELKHEIPVVPVPFPSPEELNIPLQTVIESQPDGSKPADEAVLLSAARGLTLSEAENTFSLCSNDGFGVSIVEREKMRLVRSNCMTVERAESPEMLAGLSELKSYVTNEILPHKDDLQLMVKGLALVGVPGTGKSLSAKVIAHMLGWPLVRFTMSSAKSSKVGESENNLKQALAIADAVAPCVLWADEAEKAVGGYQSSNITDGGTTSGMVGMLLTWQQEHTSPVLLVMTINDYLKMPAEMMRPGRMDEKFFLDLPTPDERHEIAKVHLKRLKAIAENRISVTASYVADVTGEFTGAEIEAVIKSAARRTRRKVTEESLKQAAEEIKPISRTRNIKELREWAKDNLRMANDQPIAPITKRTVRKDMN